MSQMRGKKDNLISRLSIVVVLSALAFLFIIFSGYARYVFNMNLSQTITLKDATMSPTDITIEPTTWTNDKVGVSISTTKTGGEIYYKIGDDGNWTKYEGEFNITENSTVYARLTYSDGSGPETEKEITNIDKINPTTTAPDATSTTGKITVTSNHCRVWNIKYSNR